MGRKKKEVVIEAKSVVDDPLFKAEQLQKIDGSNRKLEELSFGEKLMSGPYIAAQLRQAAKQLEPVISNLDQQKSELLLKEVEKLAEHLRKMANLISEACELGKQKNLFEPPEQENPSEGHLAKTLLTLDPPDKKSAAAGERGEVCP